MALRDDNINLHINVTSSEAQESIRRLSESKRDLEKNNRAVRLGMEKLKAQGKAESEELKQLGATKDRMGELKGAGQSLAGQLSGFPGPAGSVVQGVMGINSAFKILLANPITAIIAAIAAVLMALYITMKSSEETTNKLNAIFAPLGAIMDHTSK